MRPTLEESADDLAHLSTYSEPKIDAIVDTYLAGFGQQTVDMRTNLRDAFKKRAFPSDLTDCICRRILRGDQA